MNNGFTKSDWKKFTAMLPEVREKYLAEMCRKYSQDLDEEDVTATDRFWSTYENMEKTSKILVDCLDGYARSNMILKVLLMRRYRLLSDADLEQFSDEFRDTIARHESI